MKKKYPKIIPQILQDEKGNKSLVYLPYKTYESLLEVIQDLENEIDELKSSRSLNLNKKKNNKKKL